MSLSDLFIFQDLHFSILIVFVSLGLFCLTYGGDRLTEGAIQLALILKINPIIIGLTIVSMATSFPELLTSSISVLKGSSGLAVGNIIGSNIANIGLILGVAAIIWPFKVDSQLIRFEIPFLIVTTLLFCVLGYVNILNRATGLLFLAIMVFYLIRLVKQSRKKKDPVSEEIEEQLQSTPNSYIKPTLLVFAGAALLAIGADSLVSASQEIAIRFGVSDTIIGLTIVAIGTSLPELAATIAASLKKQSALAAGNIIGSNLFNILFIGGSVSIIKPLNFEKDLFHWEIPAMLFLTALLWRFFISDKEITRKEGIILLSTYIITIAYTSFS